MLFLLPGPPHAPIHTQPPRLPPHTNAVINTIHTSLDPYTPVEDNQIETATKGLQNCSKTYLQRREHPSRSSSVLAFLRLGASVSEASVSGPSVSGSSVSGPSVSEASVGVMRLGDIRLYAIRLRGIRRGHPFHGHPSHGHPLRRHPSRGRPSLRLGRPRRMAQKDAPEMDRHLDGGSIRLSFLSQGHPPVPSVSGSSFRPSQSNTPDYFSRAIQMTSSCFFLIKRIYSQNNYNTSISSYL